MTKGITQVRGQAAEDMAWNYLREAGLIPITRNYRSPFGEIDLIMQDQHNLVFVEVRFRRSARFGSAAETVDRRKQRKLVATAQHYLQHNARAARHAARFDVISIMPAGGDYQIEWIKDAFHHTV